MGKTRSQGDLVADNRLGVGTDSIGIGTTNPTANLDVRGDAKIGVLEVGIGNTDVIVTGDMRVTGILTVGSSSLTLDGTNNVVNVGTALTLGHTQGVQFHTQNLHSDGFEVNNINASGVITATSFVGDGANLTGLQAGYFEKTDAGINTSTNIGIGTTNPTSALTVSGDANITGVVTASSFVGNMTGDATGLSGSPSITVTDITASGNVSIAGTLTYEDVTNVDSVGLVTARTGVKVTTGGIEVSAGGLNVTGVSTFTGNINVTGTVDGRDIATDGTKLDGIESGATGDQTASEILTAIKTVDGSGSGLDADTVDGINSASFLRSDANDSTGSQITFTTSNVGCVHHGAEAWMVSSSDAAYQRGDGRDDATNFARLHWYGVSDTGTTSNFRHAWYDGSAYINVTVDSSEVRFARTSGTTYLKVDGNTVWHAGNDGSGSGLDADLWDGNQFSSYLNQALLTTSDPTFSDIYANDWFRNNNAGEGLYNQSTASHFYSAGANYWHINSSSTGNAALIFYSNYNSTQGNSTNRKGYVYWDSSGFGLLSNDGSWAYRHNNTHADIYGTIRQDGSNTVWHAGNDGSGSGLDADLLDGAQPNTAYSTSTIVQRDGNGDIRGRYLIAGTSDGSGGWVRARIGADSNQTPSSYVIESSGWYYQLSKTDFQNHIAAGLTADKANLLASRGNYNTSASTLPASWDYGQRVDFVRSNEGWFSYGTVITTKSYSGGGGTLQMYVPYGSGYGGVSLKYRMGDYSAGASGNTWTSWRTIWDTNNDGSGSGLDADNLDGYTWTSGTNAKFSRIEFTGVGGNSGNSVQSYAIYQEAGAWSSPYPDLVIGYHTGIKIGGHKSYNGTRFYSDAPGRTGAVELFSVGNGDNHVRVQNDLLVYGNARLHDDDQLHFGTSVVSGGNYPIRAYYSSGEVLSRVRMSRDVIFDFEIDSDVLMRFHRDTAANGCVIFGNYSNNNSYVSAKIYCPDACYIGGLRVHNGRTSLPDGYRNSIVGDSARTFGTANGSDNTCIGYASGRDMSTGVYNTQLGSNCQRKVTSGSYGTYVGANAGYNKTTGNYCTAIGYNADYYLQNGNSNTTYGYTNTTCLGYDSRISGSNQLQLGNSSVTSYAYGSVQNRSDARDKTDIRDTILGLDFIKRLRPVDFRWDYRDDYYDLVVAEDVVDDVDPENIHPQHKLEPVAKDGSRARTRFHHGLIAQDVKETMDEMGIDFAGYQDHSIKDGLDVLSIGYTELIGPMIKAIQEQQAQIEALTAEIQALKNS